ncbi:MAG: ABC transporter permease [Opitutaceae bacterium]|nr:ABC transporter permease [Opitutaceae bacterium]
MNDSLPFSLGRVGVLAGNAFREAVRHHVFRFMTLFAVALILGCLGLGELNFGESEAKFIADFGQGALVLFGSILTIGTAVQWLGGDGEPRAVLTVLAKPLRRSEYVCGRFLGTWMVVLVFCALVTALLVGVLWTRTPAASVEAMHEAPLVGLGGVSLAGVAVAGALQAVKFGLLTAMVLLIASFAQTNLFALSVSALVLVICHLQYLARDSWQAGQGWIERLGGSLVGLVFPNFQLFGGGEWLEVGVGVSLVAAGRVAAYGLAYTAVFLVLAVWSFRRREI